MDDLISRKIAIDQTMGKLDYTDVVFDTATESEIVYMLRSLPSVPAVPLDKLCEWLANSFSGPPCCTLENVRCKMECRGFTQMDYSECWRYVLNKWVEGLDAAESMVQKT